MHFGTRKVDFLGLLLEVFKVLAIDYSISIRQSTGPGCYQKSKKGGKDQQSIQSSTTPDPGYHMEKRQKHN